MGLDIAEFVMEIEDTFRISIPDDSDLPTIGAIIDFVQQQLTDKAGRRCYTGACFYALRTAVMQVTGRERHTLRPTTPLSEIVPPRDNGAFALAIRDELPEFKKTLPDWRSRSALLNLVFTLGVVAGLYYHPIATVLAFAGILLLNRTIKRSPNIPGTLFSVPCLPKSAKTLGDAARAMAAKLHPEDMHGASPLPVEIERHIIQIASEITQIPPEKITRDSRIVADLGMG